MKPTSHSLPTFKGSSRWTRRLATKCPAAISCFAVRATDSYKENLTIYDFLPTCVSTFAFEVPLGCLLSQGTPQEDVRASLTHAY